MASTFWLNDPTILLNKEYILQLWPTSSMSFEENLNAISRLIIILSILGFLATRSINIIIVGVVTLIVIIILYNTRKPKLMRTKEGFSTSNGLRSNGMSNGSPVIDSPKTLQKFLNNEFVLTSKKNPLSNVLLTDIADNPTRKAAPPSFNIQVYEDINNNTKKMIQTLNPGIKNTNKQLFGDLGEKFEFDQSMSRFYSTPNTKIANDQGAFAEYLYGDMPSCRNGDPFACVQDNLRYNLY
jgi:hypothetical protein